MNTQNDYAYLSQQAGVDSGASGSDGGGVSSLRVVITGIGAGWISLWSEPLQSGGWD